MKKTKKALASIAIAGMTLSMIPFNAFAATTTTRIAGMTAEQTAVKIADQTGYTGTAILASSTSYGMVDALTAGPLAASLKAPILLTGAGNTLNADTKAELTKLAVKKVYVTSGTAVIKAGVIDELKAMGIEVVALGGFDRAETSVNIAKQMTGVTKVAVANGVPDALSIASVASAANQPILLTNKDMLPASVAAYLATAGVTSTDVIGGTGVISDAVVAGLPGATRHFGMTAYDTNNQVIQDFAAGLEFDNVYVANGQTGIDALAGAPLAAQTKSAIVLTDGKSVPAAAAFTYGKSPVGAVVTALGGEAVVPESVRMGVAAGQVTTDPNTAPLAIVSVSALTDDGHVLAVSFNKAYTGALDKSMVSIFASDSLSRVGVDRVELASNGMSAEIVLYDNTSEGAAHEIVRLKNYTIKLGALNFEFARPMYADQDTAARVIAVDADEREITVTTGITGYTKNVLDVPESMKVDFQQLLGQNVRVWWNADDVVLDMEIQSESFVEAIEFDLTDEEITLVGSDEDIDLADDYEFFLNDKSKDLGDDVNNDGGYDYAKVILNKDGDVAYIYAYNWNSYMVVEEVDGDVLISYDDELDLEDYIIVKNGMQIAIDDLEKGDIVYYNADANDKDGYAVVYNDSVSGEIDDVFSAEIRIDGTTYNYAGDKYGKATQYLDGDELADVDSDVAEEFQAGGSVTLFLDHKGDAVYLTGDQEAVESNKTGFVLTETPEIYHSNGVAMRGTIELEGVNGDEDEKAYTLRVDSLDKITVEGKKYEVDKYFPITASTVSVNKIDKFALALDEGIIALDKDNRIIEADGDLGATFTTALSGDLGAGAIVQAGLIADNDFIEVETDDDGKVIGLEFMTEGELENTDDELKLDDKYLEGFKLMSSTVVFDRNAGSDADDIVVSTWGDLKDKGFKISEAFYYLNTDDEVEYLVIENSDADTETPYNAVVTKVLRNTSDEIIELTALLDGVKKTYAVNKVDNDLIEKGLIVELSINDDNGVVEDVNLVTGSHLIKGKVAAVSVSDKTITIGTTKHKMSSDYSVINVKDKSDILVKALRDVKVGDNVQLSQDEKSTQYVDVVAILAADVANDGAGDIAGSYIVNSYHNGFNRLALEDADANEITRTIDSFEAVYFGDVEVTKAAMKAWMQDENAAGIDVDDKYFVGITDDDELVVTHVLTGAVVDADDAVDATVAGFNATNSDFLADNTDSAKITSDLAEGEFAMGDVTLEITSAANAAVAADGAVTRPVFDAANEVGNVTVTFTLVGAANQTKDVSVTVLAMQAVGATHELNDTVVNLEAGVNLSAVVIDEIVLEDDSTITNKTFGDFTLSLKAKDLSGVADVSIAGSTLTFTDAAVIVDGDTVTLEATDTAGNKFDIVVTVVVS